MISFAQRFRGRKKEGGGNSIQRQVILESMQDAESGLAAQVSQANSSASNIEAILTRDSKDLAPDVKSEEEKKLEQEIEGNSVEKRLKAIELAVSQEELSALMPQYEECLASWSKKVFALRSEKHLKEYLSIVAALTMLQKLLQNPELLKGKQLSEIVQNSLKSQQQSIADQAKQIQAQNYKLHEQTQQFTRQLSGVEQSLNAAIEAFKKDSGKLTPQELQNNVKQIQETLKQVQALKEKAVRGKPLDFKEMPESLQKIQQQQQRLIESGKLGDIALKATLQLQQSLQQTLQQTNLAGQLHENINRLQTIQIEQIRQHSSQIMPAQVSTLVTDRINSQSQKVQEQEKLLPKQLSTAEQSLKSVIESMQKDSGKLSQKEQQENLKQLQELHRKIQELKEGKDGKQVIPKEILESLQRVQQQQQRLIENGKLGNTALQEILTSQKAMQQTLQQAKSIQQLQENIGKLQTQHTIHQSDSVMQANTSALVTEKSHIQMLSVESAKQQTQKDPATLVSRPEEKVSDILPKLQKGALVSAELLTQTDIRAQQSKITERTEGVGDKVVDITSRLRERVEAPNPQYKSLAKDPLSLGHVHGPGCGYGQTNNKTPQAMGHDVVSKAQAHGPGCGCSSCGGGHDHHKHQQQTQHKANTEKHEHHHKHEHGPSCSCCGHGAKATEIGRTQQMARAG